MQACNGTAEPLPSKRTNVAGEKQNPGRMLVRHWRFRVIARSERPNRHATPRTHCPLTHRPGWLNRDRALPHSEFIGRRPSTLDQGHRQRPWKTARADHGHGHPPQSIQAPSKGCLTWGYTWSGRRDSNPRPSPWQGDALPLSHFRVESHYSNGFNRHRPPLPRRLQGPYFSSRDIRRSANSLELVWQVGQYCRLFVAKATSRTVSPHSGQS